MRLNLSSTHIFIWGSIIILSSVHHSLFSCFSFHAPPPRSLHSHPRHQTLHLTPTPPPPVLLPPGWKAILVLDWRMMMLLRESLHQHRGGRGERSSRREAERGGEKSSGGVVAPRGAVAVMGELSNAPLSKLPSEHHVTTRD